MAEQLSTQGINVNIDYVNKGGGTGSKIDFHLNADGSTSKSQLNRSSYSPYYGDVFDYNSVVDGNNDVFFINFNMPFSDGSKSYSNESAAVKQGFAVGLAIKKVLLATGADKVILFGHSMGGLAIREYLQNSSNWPMGDGQHHVAKLITTGTPHGGSNETSGNALYLLTSIGLEVGNERSEAVRDLRYPKPLTVFDRGVYLFGGSEDDIFRLGAGYFNNDIDCNGYVGGQVTGLNQKSLYLDLAYACIIGTGGNALTGLIGPNDDDIVEADRANLFNLGYTKLTGDLFYIDKSNAENRSIPYTTADRVWHTKLPKQTFVNMYALDEPETTDLAYQIQSNKEYKGFLTPHPIGSNPNGYNYDTDLYKLYLPSRGIAELSLQSSNGSQSGIRFFDSSNNLLSSTGDGTIKVNVKSAGTYYVAISGNGGDPTFGWHFNDYTYRVNFCPEPDQLVITNNTPNEICDNQKATLTASSGYDSYRWYADGAEIGITTNQIVPSVSGTFSVQGIKSCGITRSATNTIKLTIKPTSSTPAVSTTAITYCVGEIAQPLSATGTQLQWYTQAIGGTAYRATPIVSTSIAQTVVYYVTQTNPNSCESSRQPITINVTAPPTPPGILTKQFICQFEKSVPLIAQGQNLLWRSVKSTLVNGTAPSPITDIVDTLQYTVTQQVGNCVSQAASVTVIIRKAPEPPKLVSPISACIDTKMDALNATGTAIKWYTNGERTGQSASVFAPPTVNAGQFTYYATQTDVNGCESLPTTINVIIRPKPTATLPNDLVVIRYDSIAIPITLTGDSPWQVTLWNGRVISATQSPLTVYIKPTITASYTLQNVTNVCGAGSTGRAMQVTLMEPLAVSSILPDDLWLSVYPTPTESTLQLDWRIPSGQVGTLQLVTLNGQTIWQRSVRGTGGKQTEVLLLQSQPGGQYILQLTTAKGVITRKVVKQ